MAEYANAREFLAAVWKKKMEVQRCMWDVNLLRDRCRQITACLEAGRGGGGNPHRDGTLAALADKQEELLKLEEELERGEQEAERFLERIGDERWRAILRLRYVNRLRWTEVQKQMEKLQLYYSERQVYNLHRSAVREAERLFAEDRKLLRGA